MGLGSVVLISLALISVNLVPVSPAFVDPRVVFTEWAGFGSSLAWFGDVLGGLPQNVQDEIISGLFSPDRLNLNILRYTIGGTTPGNLVCGPFRPGGGTESFKDGPDMPYNWTRDPRARKVLLAAIDLGVDTIEAFSNSPPQWMTKSGCSKGNPDGGSLHDNFDPKNSDQFADYLTEVVKYYHDIWNVTFSTLAPFNEPSSGYWPGPGGNQEGCCMERNTMIEVIRSLSAALQAKGMDYTTISVADETEINQELLTQQTFTNAGIAGLYKKVNTHGYSDNGQENRAPLYTLTQKNGHVLWMDEVGWSATPVNDMTQGMALAERIVLDIRNMNPAAWVYWQAMEDQKNGAWGLVDIPYEDASLDKVRYSSGYYSMLQISKYIKKGYQIVHVSDSNSIAAYDEKSQTLVIVVYNSGTTPRSVTYDLRLFSSQLEVTATRTSATEQNANLGTIPLNGEKQLTDSSPSKSVTTFVIKNAVVQTPLINLLNNGDFESPDKNSWYLMYGNRDDGGINGNYVYRGQMSGYLDFSISELTLYQNVTAPATKTYYLSGRVASSASDARFGVLLNGVQGPEVSIAAWKGYMPLGVSFEANVNDIISVYVYWIKSDGNAQIDDVVLH